MGLSDIVLMALVVGWAGYLLYRSMWKKAGRCAGGCSSGACQADETKKPC
ncbi:MAG: FeoB-associated Cys-rich membrane protein [Nitrospiraceae bacterium]|nr:FeoB-associated Cys-rich membrane protein [Nitrospiraceae bacterium]